MSKPTDKSDTKSKSMRSEPGESAKKLDNEDQAKQVTDAPDGHASYINDGDLSEIEDFLKSDNKKKSKSGKSSKKKKDDGVGKSTHDLESKYVTPKPGKPKVEQEIAETEEQLELEMVPLQKLRKYLEQYDSNIGPMIDNPESRNKNTNRIMIGSETTHLFRKGQILGYCIFKVSRRELDERLLDLNTAETQAAIKGNWIIIQKELQKLDIFLNWSQIVLMIRGENLDIINKVMQELTAYVNQQDKYFDNPNVKARKRTKKQRLRAMKKRGFLNLLYEGIRRKDIFSAEG